MLLAVHKKKKTDSKWYVNPSSTGSRTMKPIHLWAISVSESVLFPFGYDCRRCVRSTIGRNFFFASCMRAINSLSVFFKFVIFKPCMVTWNRIWNRDRRTYASSGVEISSAYCSFRFLLQILNRMCAMRNICVLLSVPSVSVSVVCDKGFWTTFGCWSIAIAIAIAIE